MSAVILRYRAGAATVMTALALSVSAQPDDQYLKWTRERAEGIGRQFRVDGRVGGIFDLRVIRTERSFNYKLRATLLTPDVIRATARLHQLSAGLTDAETIDLVTEAERAGDLVVMLEVDPREGSGVLPRDLVVLLRPKDGDEESTIRGVLSPRLREARALAGTFRRDYAYEQLWAVFSLTGPLGRALLAPDVTHLEVVMRIYDKEGQVSWPVPGSLRTRKPS